MSIKKYEKPLFRYSENDNLFLHGIRFFALNRLNRLHKNAIFAHVNDLGNDTIESLMRMRKGNSFADFFRKRDHSGVFRRISL